MYVFYDFWHIFFLVLCAGNKRQITYGNSKRIATQQQTKIYNKVIVDREAVDIQICISINLLIISENLFFQKPERPYSSETENRKYEVVKHCNKFFCIIF